MQIDAGEFGKIFDEEIYCIKKILYITQVLTKEYYTLQTSSERKASEMDSQLADKAAKLETYEKLEQELDDVVMQAAEGKCCSIEHYSSPRYAGRALPIFLFCK